MTQDRADDKFLAAAVAGGAEAIVSSDQHLLDVHPYSLRRCVTMMQRLLPAFLLVWIDHGSDEDSGPMCYPPLPTQAGSAGNGGFRSRKPR